MQLLPSETDDRLMSATQASGILFKNLYFLPGNGTKTSGVFLQNASNDLALGLIPA